MLISRPSPLNHHSRTNYYQFSDKTMSLEEQIISKDQYPCTFVQPNGGYCVYYQSIFVRTTQDRLSIGEYHWDIPKF